MKKSLFLFYSRTKSIFECHMDYFTDALTTFLGLVSVVLPSMEDHIALGFHQKYLNLCFEDQPRSHGVWNDMKVMSI